MALYKILCIGNCPTSFNRLILRLFKRASRIIVVMSLLLKIIILISYVSVSTLSGAIPTRLEVQETAPPIPTPLLVATYGAFPLGLRH